MQRNVWLLSAPVRAQVNEAMQEFTNIKFTGSEQHKDMGITRQKRDAEDSAKLLKFLSERNPFTGSPGLRNIVTEVEDEDANADSAKEVGQKIPDQAKGKHVEKIPSRKPTK